MHLRSIIRGRQADHEPSQSCLTVATVAVAEVVSPNGWANRLRTLPPADGIQWSSAADILDSLMVAGVIDKALGLGWDAREIIGVCRSLPHDSPSRAGLIWSVKPGDTVPDVRRSGCIIAYGKIRHIWRRTELAAEIILPWELGTALRELSRRVARLDMGGSLDS